MLQDRQVDGLNIDNPSGMTMSSVHVLDKSWRALRSMISQRKSVVRFFQLNSTASAGPMVGAEFSDVAACSAAQC